MKRGVVVMAYGTPRTRDEVGAYYTHIRHGRPPTAEQLADLVRRYDAIGGVSPLAERTDAQRARLQSALGPGFCVALGNKHAAPFVEDAVVDLARAGAGALVGLVLAPHYSRASVGEYHARLRAAAAAHALAVTTIDSWHLEAALVEFHAAAVRDALERLPAPTTVVFTAHSLPVRAVADGDPYVDQLYAGAAAIAARAGLGEWATAWQSAGRTPDPWLGPDIRDVIADAAAAGAASVLVCPHGFTSDHLEILYDLDVDAAAAARGAGIAFARTPSVNDDPAVFAALAPRIAATAAA